MKNNVNRVVENSLCLGCGLCESVYPKQLEVYLGENGKYNLKITGNIDNQDFTALCPVFSNNGYSDRFWGNYIKTFFGNSADSNIRHGASSGGLLTQTLVYLIEEKSVDAIIHVGTSVNNPFFNEYKISLSKSDVLMNMGSRYAPVKLLSDFINILNRFDKIAIVGKPCDLRAVNNYFRINTDQKDKVVYMFSFFCGGIPSQNATYKIIDIFNIDKNQVIKFDYRGNGWPGYTTAVLENGEKKTMDYSQSWGRILGRDIHKSCKFCADGLGEEADFSCGDGWYSTQNGYPEFEEKDGRNLIMCRSKKGLQLLNDMCHQGLISLEEVKDTETTLKNIQIGQYFRKSTLFGKVIATRICSQYISAPPLAKLWKWREDKNLLRQIKVSMGTIKRISQGKL